MALKGISPTPWELCKDLDQKVINIISDADGSLILSTWANTHPANANLVAAAPDLYDALSLIARDAGCEGMSMKSFDAMNSALKKARGRDGI